MSSFTSAERSFRMIALHKRLLTKRELGDFEEQLNEVRAKGHRATLEGLIEDSGKLTAAELNRIITTRARHGRACSDCGGLTFLLPGERSSDLDCEHCQGSLLQGRLDQGTDRSSGSHPIAKPEEYRKLLERCEQTDDPNLFMRAATFAEDLDRHDEARMLLGKALELRPSHYYARRHLERLSRDPSPDDKPSRGPAAKPLAPSTGRLSPSSYVELYASEHDGQMSVDLKDSLEAEESLPELGFRSALDKLSSGEDLSTPLARDASVRCQHCREAIDPDDRWSAYLCQCGTHYHTPCFSEKGCVQDSCRKAAVKATPPPLAQEAGVVKAKRVDPQSRAPSESSRGFPVGFGEALSYPLSPTGLSAIVLGGLLFGPMEFFTRNLIALSMGATLALFPYLYVYAYFGKVIAAGSRGTSEVPSWPDLSALSQGLRLLACTYIVLAAAWGVAITSGVGAVMMVATAANSPVGLEEKIESDTEQILEGRSGVGFQDLDTSPARPPLVLRSKLESLSFVDSAGEVRALSRFYGRPTVLGLRDIDDQGDLEELAIYRSLVELSRRFPTANFALLGPGQPPTPPEGPRPITLLYSGSNEYPGQLAQLQDHAPCALLITPAGIGKRGPQRPQASLGTLNGDSVYALDELVTEAFYQSRPTNLPNELSALGSGAGTSWRHLLRGINMAALLMTAALAFLLLLVYYPVAALLVTMFGNWTMVLRFPAVIRTTFVLGRSYFFWVLPIWATTYILSWISQGLLITILDSVVSDHWVAQLALSTFAKMLSWAVFIYGLLVTGHLLGRLYHYKSEELGWF